MKIKFFIAGLKTGVWFANTLPYAFMAGVVRGMFWYSESIEKGIVQNKRLEDWMAKADPQNNK